MMKSRRRLRFLLVLLVAAAAAQAEETGAADAGHLRPQTEYFAVFLGGKKIGRAKYTRQVLGKKVISKETLQMTISRLGQPMTVSVEETFTETADGRPVSLRLVADLGAIPITVKGLIGQGNRLNLTRTMGQTKQQQTIRWPEGAVMPEGARLQARKMGLKEGTTYAYRFFDALSMATVEKKVRIGPVRSVDLLGRVVKLTEVRTTTVVSTAAGSFQVEGLSYVDKDLRELKCVMPMLGTRVELIACSRQFAVSRDDVVDFMDKLILTSPVSLRGIASAKSATYHLAPSGDQKLSVPATDSQTVRPGRGGTLIVTVRPVRAPAGVSFPYQGKDRAALEALKPTRFLQSDDEKLIALARKAVGDAKDAAEAVGRIEGFVRKYIRRKDLSVGYASAAEVADSREGDCSEHAVLAAAMCRAVGIPARVVSGLVYVERVRQRRRVFATHAWAQAFVGGKWGGLDAIMNGFDPGHIALAVGNGNPESFFQIFSSLGHFKIVRVEVEK